MCYYRFVVYKSSAARPPSAQIFHRVLGRLRARVLWPGRRVVRGGIGRTRVPRRRSSRRRRHVPGETFAEELDGFRLVAVLRSDSRFGGNDVRTRRDLHAGRARP